MKKTFFLTVLAAGFAMGAYADQATVTVKVGDGQYTISRHIYGHFSEHLGRGIYDGLWVGEDSHIPNIKGVRTDIIDALKHIRIPNLRWPGGCFADEYHWMDGIGPRTERPRMINTHWGGVVEDNAFGTHEFLDLCETLGTEPYICGNVGSGTVEEMAKWVEYITFDGESPMADLRRRNGRDEPWKVKYWGVGNENWGCGGNMTAEYYTGEYRRYQTYCRNFGDNRLYKIAGGPNAADYHWMEVLMRDIPLRQMDGVSVHYYTVPHNWSQKGSAYEFDDDEYYLTISKAAFMDELITRHSEVMDRYDPQKRVQLIVDEWGSWYDPHPGSNPGFLYQMNTMRDAILAGVTLNIFHKHCDRVHMANIAQLVNVLQALILTEGDRMILTPTYHVFDMYKVHHDATMLPVEVGTTKTGGNNAIDQVSASASRNGEGTVHISLVNSDLDNEVTVTCRLDGLGNARKGKGQVIAAENITDYNSFDEPEKVVLYDFDNFEVKDGILSLTLPARSVVTVSVSAN